jgi:polyhydroxybutyrate depolymerase
MRSFPPNRQLAGEGMKISIRNLLLLFAAGIPSAMRAEPGRLVPHPFTHNGYSRPYLVYTPGHLGAHPPVVFVLGGVSSSAASTAQELGWTEEADRNGFLVVFPEPLTQDPSKPFVKRENTTFWEMQGSRTHIVGSKAPVDDDGYLMGVLNQLLHTQAVDGKRVFMVGFSSGSGMVQLLASRHPRSIAAIAAIATPLMEPPPSLAQPVAVLYIHGDDDEQFSGFEVNSPDFATTPHGNWVTWGYLDGCHVQRAKKTPWGVQFSWEGCRKHVPVIADFVHGLDHEWLTSKSPWNLAHRPDDPLDFAEIVWKFLVSVPTR